VKVSAIKEKKQKRDNVEKSEAICLARNQIQTHKNKALRALKAKGVVAHREEKVHKGTVKQLLKNGDLVPFHLFTLLHITLQLRLAFPRNDP